MNSYNPVSDALDTRRKSSVRKEPINVSKRNLMAPKVKAHSTDDFSDSSSDNDEKPQF